MITLCVLVYIVWTIARFRKGRYMGWTKFGYSENAPWYAFLWDLAHWVAAIGFVVYLCIKYFK